jgi:hypothetical protein
MRATIAVCLAFVLRATAQQNAAAIAARQWRETHERAILVELARFLSIPNLADSPGNLRHNADAAVAMLEGRGIKTQMLARRPRHQDADAANGRGSSACFR